MKIFEVKTEQSSLGYPIVKILICMFVILICIFRNRFICVTNAFSKVVVATLCVVLTIACVLCIYISIGELFHIYSDGLNKNKSAIEPKGFSVEVITRLVSENDILEMLVQTQSGVFSIGASSNSQPWSATFYDKRYYIGCDEYNDLESFVRALLNICPTGIVPVLEIDGIAVE